MNRKNITGIKKYSIAVLLLCCSISACKEETTSLPDTAKSGTIHISVDESFKPVIEEQIKVYEAIFPATKIIAHYKTEADCLKDLFRDTANRMVIVTRGLTDDEDAYLRDSLNYPPHWNDIASDAITIVVNSKSNDTLFDLTRLQQQLSGTAYREQTVVFDGLNATSTVRFAIDSILHGKKFDTSVVKAVKSSQEVLNYVASNDNAVGFVGISWIGNPEDSAQVNMLRKVKIAYVGCAGCADSPYVKPMQLSILTRRYPLVRGLYYILKENYNGLGTGFVNFMKNERGQLIFKRAYLGAKMGFGVRNVKINQKLQKD